MFELATPRSCLRRSIYNTEYFPALFGGCGSGVRFLTRCIRIDSDARHDLPRGLCIPTSIGSALALVWGCGTVGSGAVGNCSLHPLHSLSTQISRNTPSPESVVVFPRLVQLVVRRDWRKHCHKCYRSVIVHWFSTICVMQGNRMRN